MNMFLTVKCNMQAVVALAGRCRRTCRRRHGNRKSPLSLVSPLFPYDIHSSFSVIVRFRRRKLIFHWEPTQTLSC